MTFRVVVEPRAVRDLWAAAQWIGEQSKITGHGVTALEARPHP